MRDREWEALIAAQGELAGVPATLRQAASHIRTAAGQPIFRTGARPAKMFWVLDGEMRLVRRSPVGAEIVLQRASSGFVAEASLDSSRYHCDAVAVVPSRLLAFPVSPFRQALNDDERFRLFWMGRLAREVRALRSQCERLALHGAADRIEHYIASEGDHGCLKLSCTRKAWAAELGLTHEALYRALAELQRSGRISMAKRGEAIELTLWPRGVKRA